MLKILKILVVACIVAIVPTSSLAERVNITIAIDCREDSIAGKDHLYKEYGETILFTGIFDGNKHILHFFGNAETGGWSFVSLNTDGMYCLIYSGDGLTLVPHYSEEEQRAKTY